MKRKNGVNLWLAAGSPTPASSDARLVRECLSGNEQAWAALIDKYKRLIYSIPIKYQASQDDAAEIFQAVCLELFSDLPRLRKVESLRSWLITVTTRKCVHWKRRQRIVESGRDDAAMETIEGMAAPPEMYEEVEQEQILRDAIARLPRRCQELIRMLFYETPAVPYSDVAQRLGLATGSIGFIRGRCLKRLKQLLEELGF